MLIKVTEIEWDADNEIVEELNSLYQDTDNEFVEELPTECVVDVEYEDMVADALSDKYGWCVNSFEYNVL